MGAVKTSVALCTYNGARFVAEQIESISAQSQQPDEMIVCDDGSEDETVKILQKFALNAKFPVRVFRNPVRLGAAANFEQAIGLCAGDVIFLCDQDDIWMPEKVVSLVSALADHPQALYAFSDARTIDAGSVVKTESIWANYGVGRAALPLSGLAQLRLLVRENFIPGASMALRASFRSAFLPIPVGWMHDYWIVLLASVLAYGVPVAQPLFLYRTHKNQVCGSQPKASLSVIRNSLSASDAECRAKARQYKQLCARASAIVALAGRTSEAYSLIRDKEVHLSIRAEIRCSKGMAKLRQVFAEALTGRYRLSGNSVWDAWHSIGRDLL
jgi:hypothetical protein